MKTKGIPNSEKSKIHPVLVSAVSDNHWTEHTQHTEIIKRSYPGQKLIIYDLGLSDERISKIKSDEFYEYRKFEFKKYPWHVRLLWNFSWKILIWREVLLEHKALQYFDSSIWLRNSSSAAIQDKIFQKGADFLYYIKPAGHDITTHVHPGMYNYLPFDYVRDMDPQNVLMRMPGAVIIYNTEYLKDKILKWAFLCALTRDCIAPLGSMKGCGKPNRWMYDQEMYADMYEMPYLTEDGLKGRKPDKHWLTCHRFDQALLSILWANELDNDFSSITLAKNDTNNFAFLTRSHEKKLIVGEDGKPITVDE